MLGERSDSMIVSCRMMVCYVRGELRRKNDSGAVCLHIQKESEEGACYRSSFTSLHGISCYGMLHWELYECYVEVM
jgi:hypothetical protein